MRVLIDLRAANSKLHHYRSKTIGSHTISVQSLTSYSCLQPGFL